MNDDDRPRRRRSIHMERRDGRYELVGRGGARVAVLNETAAALWELCDGQTEIREMIDAVCELFQLEVDVARTEVLTAMEALGAVAVLRLGPAQD